MRRHQGRAYAACGLALLSGLLYLNLSHGPDLSLRLPFPWLQPAMPFVRRNSTHFFLSPAPPSPAPLYLNGWNSYWMLAASAASPAARARVPDMLRRGRRMGMAVCRTWAFSDGGPNALQIFPGRFDPDVFGALDYVVYQARRNGVWLVLSLVNNLEAFGGKASYVRWARAAGANVSSGDDFFSDPTIRAYYRDYVKTILTRENSYSGIKYSEEPAIFAWELINEPRCASNSCAPFLQAWIVEMAAYVKSLDDKHLVTVGLEGFYGPRRSNRLKVNPGEWAASLGSDFILNSATEHIDFASVHAYPDNWIPNATFEEKARYLEEWVDTHVNDSENILKKPVLFTEVGSLLHNRSEGLPERDVLLKIIYDKIYESAKRGGAGAGAFLWQLMVEGMQRDSDAFSLVARQNPGTQELIVRQSCRLNRLWRRKEDNRQDVQPCDGI